MFVQSYSSLINSDFFLYRPATAVTLDPLFHSVTSPQESVGEHIVAQLCCPIKSVGLICTTLVLGIHAFWHKNLLP